MKKLIFILFLFTCIKASAQIPIRSSANVADEKLYVIHNFTPPRYNDTTQANLNLGLDSCGAIIYTRSDQKLWKRVCSPTKHWEEIGSGSGGSGSVEYVKPGRYTLVDSVGRNYTINVDTAGLFTIIRQEIHDSISGINLADTIYTKQPLYVDAGVKDTLKLNADSSGLVRDVMRSNDSVYIKINGVWEFAFIDSVGSGGGGGSVEYVLQGWGTKVDSVGRNYTVGVDTNLIVNHTYFDSVINNISGSVEYVKQGRYTLIDSTGRNYTVNVDTAGLLTIVRQTIHDSIAGIDIAKDTVYAKQPLYVDAGVKDTVKFNADSSGLVRDVMRSNDSVYLKINGVWEFAFIDSVGSGGGGGGSVEYVTQG